MTTSLHKNETPDDTPIGGRNNALFNCAMSLKAKGLSHKEIKRRVNVANKKLSGGPLGKNELEKTIFAALKKK